MRMLAIARATILEAARRRLLVAQALLSLLVVALTALGFHLLTGVDDQGQKIDATVAQLIASQLLVLIMFGFSGVLALGGSLSASPAIAGDVESGVALAIIARPVSRAEVVIGKWVGLSAMVAGYAVAISGLEVLGCWLTTGYAPPDPITMALDLGLEGAVIVSASLMLSTRIPAVAAGMVTLGLFFAAWIGGIAEGAGAALQNSTISGLGFASRLLLPSDGVWRGALYAMEPDWLLANSRALGRLSRANPFLADAPPSAGYMLWVGVWLAAVLGVATWSFSRRDI